MDKGTIMNQYVIVVNTCREMVGTSYLGQLHNTINTGMIVRNYFIFSWNKCILVNNSYNANEHKHINILEGWNYIFGFLRYVITFSVGIKHGACTNHAMSKPFVWYKFWCSIRWNNGEQML